MNTTVILLLAIIILLNVTIICLAIRIKRQREENARVQETISKNDEHFSELERELQNAKAGRHDYKNHLTTIRGLIEDGNNDEAIIYIEKLIDENSREKGTISCGNAVANSILNAKAKEMQEKDIVFKTDATLPRRLNLQPTQLTVILSNLLDNAIEAAEKCSFGYVDLQLKHSKGNLIIMIKNPYNGSVKKKGDDYLTTKNDAENHGYGLKIVTDTVKRYGGTAEILHENGVFSVFIMVNA